PAGQPWALPPRRSRVRSRSHTETVRRRDGSRVGVRVGGGGVGHRLVPAPRLAYEYRPTGTPLGLRDGRRVLAARAGRSPRLAEPTGWRGGALPAGSGRAGGALLPGTEPLGLVRAGLDEP